MKTSKFYKKLTQAEVGLTKTHEVYIRMPNDFDYVTFFDGTHQENGSVIEVNFSAEVKSIKNPALPIGIEILRFAYFANSNKEKRIPGLAPFFKKYEIQEGDIVCLERIELGKYTLKIYSSEQIFLSPTAFFITSDYTDTDEVKYHCATNDPLQVIYYGAPGTGKSFKIDGMTDVANTVRTTFHPDSDYASFVGAYKPTMQPMPIHAFVGTTVHHANNAANEKAYEKKIVYKYVPQAFLKAYVAAWKDLENPHFLVIEEINRGNCAQIFGDLFQLLDRNSQGASSYAINADEDISQFLRDDENGFAKLAEETADAIRNFVLRKDNGRTEAIGTDILSGKKLLLPPNLYVWATMNTSDQSLFPIDSAFKRRWNWEYIPIVYNPIDKKTQRPLKWKFQVADKLYSWGDFLEIINPKILSLTSSEDKQMGYFFAKPGKDDNDVISEKVFVNKVLFYLWTDVFKDYDLTEEPFVYTDNSVKKPYHFTDFFPIEDNKALSGFMSNLEELGLTPISVEDNTTNSEERSKRIYGRTLIVKFPDGTVLKSDTQFDTYLQALQKIGLDAAAAAIQKKGYSRNEAPLMSKEKYESIENSATFSYVPCGEYFVIKGIDTMEGTLKGISKELGLGLDVYFE